MTKRIGLLVFAFAAIIVRNNVYGIAPAALVSSMDVYDSALPAENTETCKHTTFEAVNVFERHTEDGQYINPNTVPVVYEFLEDTLQVTAVVTLPRGVFEAECSMDGNKVSVRIIQPTQDEETDDWVARTVKIKFPGFAEGTYEVSCEWKDDEPQTVVCKYKGTSPDQGYIPMLEANKIWCTFQFSQRHVQDPGYAYESPKMICYILDSPVDRGGKMYYAMRRVGDGEDCVISYLREEDGCVYRLQDETEEETLVFNFSARTGDEFKAYSINHSRWSECVVTSTSERKAQNNLTLKEVVLSATAIPYDGETRTFSPVSNAWLEGVGAFGTIGYPEESMANAAGPERNLMLGINIGVAPAPIIAYVSSPEVCIPFDFDDMHFHGRYIASDAVGASDGRSPYDHDDLEYEFIDGTLHISGMIWASESPNHYLFCEENKDGEISLVLNDLYPKTDNNILIPIDIYIPGFAEGEYEVVERFTQNRVPLSWRSTGVDGVNETAPSASAIFDLHGRRLQQAPNHGIYIQGGRKIVK